MLLVLVVVVVVAAVEPSVQLNEIFTVTLTIVNLTGVVVDLILKVRAPNPSIPILCRIRSARPTFTLHWSSSFSFSG